MYEQKNDEPLTQQPEDSPVLDEIPADVDPLVRVSAAWKALGISKSEFYRQVDAGLIDRPVKVTRNGSRGGAAALRASSIKKRLDALEPYKKG